jgi:hypothetical protein
LIVGLILVSNGCGEMSQEQINKEILEKAKEQKAEKEAQINKRNWEIQQNIKEEQKLIYNNIMNKCLTDESYRYAIIHDPGLVFGSEGYYDWGKVFFYSKVDTSDETPDSYLLDGNEKINFMHPPVEMCEKIKAPDDDSVGIIFGLSLIFVPILLIFLIFSVRNSLVALLVTFLLFFKGR